MTDNTQDIEATEVQSDRSAQERLSIRDALEQQFEKPENAQNGAEAKAETHYKENQSTQAVEQVFEER
jgi:hypothetical protein